MHHEQRARLAIGVAPFDRGGELQHASSAVAPDGAFIGRGAYVVQDGAVVDRSGAPAAFEHFPIAIALHQVKTASY